MLNIRPKIFAAFIIIAVLIPVPVRLLSTADPKNTLVYISQTTDKAQIRWRVLGSSSEQSADVGRRVDGAVLSGNRVAFAIDSRDISVLDLTSGRQIHLAIKLETNRFLQYDADDPLQRKLWWSPNGQHLAFTGSTTETRSDVYIWSAKDETLTNVTKTLTSASNNVSAWSTDGHWLSFAANIDNNVEPFVASIDGQTITRLAPGLSACRLFWSPDNRHLVSTTLCLVNTGDDTNLLIFTFDPDHPEKPSAPVQIVSAKIGQLVSRHYATPRWYDNRTILVSRELGPALSVNLSPFDFKMGSFSTTLSRDAKSSHQFRLILVKMLLWRL